MRKSTEKRSDEVEEDLMVMGIRNWHTVARDRKERRRIVMKAKVHDGQQCLKSHDQEFSLLSLEPVLR
jgi:hypothetical protein